MLLREPTFKSFTRNLKPCSLVRLKITIRLKQSDNEIQYDILYVFVVLYGCKIKPIAKHKHLIQHSKHLVFMSSKHQNL